jgi:glutaconate CoA-transferase, subunit B
MIADRTTMGSDNAAPAAYTVEELMISALAECFEDGDQVCNGMASCIPVCAIQLARLTHAPGLLWIAGSAGVDPELTPLGASTFDPAMWREAVMYLDQYTDLWDLAASRRYLQKFCVGAAQIDRFGNLNNSVIGDFHRPKVRLPGTAGLADMAAMPKRLFYWVPAHSPRTLVERVDFRSAIGFMDGYGQRAREGIGGGPELVITNLAVLDFDPETDSMRLKSLHPGVTLSDVVEATGFDIVLPAAEVRATAAPTSEQLRLIRDVIDPEGYRYN